MPASELARVTRDLIHSVDRVAFARDISFSPTPRQEQLLTSRAPRELWNCCRGFGKSTVTSILALHDALHLAGTTVLISAPSQPHSFELFRKILIFWRTLGDEAPESVTENQKVLELTNGSRIIALSGNPRSARGYHDVSLALVDEAAQVNDELIEALGPTLGHGGRLIAMTTPKGRRGWFHKAWFEGVGWARVSITADECPYLPWDEVELHRLDWPEPKFRQEYYCEFHDADAQVFSSELIDAALKPGLSFVF